MCPLRDCDESYSHLEPMLNHVAACPKLGAAEYMCPRCSKYETYDASRYANQSGPLKRTGSKLKQAVVFFRHLGLKGCPWTCNHGSLLSKPTGTNETASELATNATSTGHSEIDSSPCFELASELELPAGDVFRSKAVLDDGVDPTCGLSSTSNTNQSCFTSSHPRSIYQPDDYNLIATSDFYCKRPPDLDLASSSSVDGQGVLEYQPQNTSQLPCQVDHAPIRPIELECPSTRQPSSSAYVGGLQELSADQVAHVVRPAALDASASCRTLDAGELLVQSKVEELHHLFNVVHSEYIMRLSLDPKLRPTCSQIPVGILFQTGLRALQDFFRERVPESFEATFALMLVATACAFMKYGSCCMPSWYLLLQESMEWRHTLTDYNERSLFTRAMIRVMKPSQHPCLVPSCRGKIPVFCGSVCPLYKPTPCKPLTSGVTTSEQAHGDSQPYIEAIDLKSLLHRLKRGRLINACTDFLDCE